MECVGADKILRWVGVGMLGARKGSSWIALGMNNKTPHLMRVILHEALESLAR